MLTLLATQRAGTDRHGQQTDVLEAEYSRFFESLGVHLVPVSNFLDDYGSHLDGLDFDGLVLSGGGDVSPALSGIRDSARLDFSTQRDRACGILIDETLARGLPVLGICYGMQYLLCRFGGSLTKDIHANEKSLRKPGLDHEVNISGGPAGLEGAFSIDHYHDSGAHRAQVPDCLHPFAVDSDYDVVEGIVHKDLPVLGLLWHPERKSPDDNLNRRLIRGHFHL